jgi:Transposase DDE domain
VSDVALLKRLRKCGQWFCWICEQLSRRLTGAELPVLPGKRIRLVDASVVCEPGATGSTWRLHYGLDLSTLCCDEVHVTDVTEGESLTRYAVEPGDVLMADRGLAHRRGIRHVVSHGGDVIVRMNLTTVPLEDEAGRQIQVLPRLRKLKVGQAGDWRAWIRDDQGLIEVRLCALKKSAAQTREAQKKVRQEAAKDSRSAQPQTLEAAGYVLVLSTLMEPSAQTMLELYRCRWQIELAFKRLKSLLQLGHLKKVDAEGAKAWLQGKLLIASLIETLIAVGERFSPWGYFLPAP